MLRLDEALALQHAGREAIYSGGYGANNSPLASFASAQSPGPSPSAVELPATMSNVNEPIRFGDVVKLQTKSAFVESAAPACLGFLELPGKAQPQLLVVPPVKDEVKDRFTEAEFIMYDSATFSSALDTLDT
ncbi:hypothetical protein ON010_g16669 [Phytophthora cinnamomi]|nr:hypothetical protein ON010_g16669 [Phytophthora cinnamomi]